jgi:hypothetical protein
MRNYTRCAWPIGYSLNIASYKISRTQTMIKLLINIHIKKNLETLHAPIFTSQQIIQNSSPFFTEHK